MCNFVFNAWILIKIKIKVSLRIHVRSDAEWNVTFTFGTIVTAVLPAVHALQHFTARELFNP